jgi:hypothetical protein
MRLRLSRLLVLAAIVSACNGDSGTTAPTPPPPPPPPQPSVLLRDIVIPNLPSPFYHFEYDAAGRVSFASYASDLFRYDVRYDGGRISEMQNNILVNHDRLNYVYDDAGRVASVRYINESGVIFVALFLSYEGQQLTGLERDRKVEGGYIVDKTMSLSYYADGNLKELTEQLRSPDGTVSTTVDRFEQYDDKTNVDGFSLIHDEFFDHLVLLPQVQLQKGNPGRQLHSGDGINYTVDYRYVYDDKNRPLTKNGDLAVLNGSDAGRRFQIQSTFTYY